MKYAALFFALVSVPNCVNPQPVTPEPPITVVDTDAGDVDADQPDEASSACARACNHMKALPCPYWRDPQKCFLGCQASRASGVGAMVPSCVIAAKSVSSAAACGVRCVP